MPFDAKERQDSVLEKQAVKRHEKKDALLKRTRKADMHMLRYKLAQEGNMTIDPGVQFNRRLILRGTPPLPDAAAAAAVYERPYVSVPLVPVKRAMPEVAPVVLNVPEPLK